MNPNKAIKKLPTHTLPKWKLKYRLIDYLYGFYLKKYQLVTVPATKKSPDWAKNTITQKR